MKTINQVYLIFLMMFIYLNLKSVELQIGYNYNVIGQYTHFYDAPDGEYNRIENGHSCFMQILSPIEKAKLGIGVEYQTRRLLHAPPYSPWCGSSYFIIQCTPVYLVVQFPVNTGKTVFEPVAEFGYSFFKANSDFAEYLYHVDNQNSQSKIGIFESNIEGFGSGLHAGLGYKIRSGIFAFQMIYKVDNGYYDVSDSRRIFINTSQLGIGISLNYDLSENQIMFPKRSAPINTKHKR